MSGFLLWIAQGFGAGRIPFAPGTFGSVVGLFWFGLLLLPGNPWAWGIGSVAGLAASVYLCDVGEKALKRKDPGSVVFDEIAALPLCFAAWLLLEKRTGVFPSPDFFMRHWPLTLGVFLLFRLFDVLKPWPVRQSQSLPGGWGITIDDALAAVYVNLVVLLIWYLRSLT